MKPGPVRLIAEEAGDVRFVEDLGQVREDLQDLREEVSPLTFDGRHRWCRYIGVRHARGGFRTRTLLVSGRETEGVQGLKPGLMGGVDELEIGREPLLDVAPQALVLVVPQGFPPAFSGEGSALAGVRQGPEVPFRPRQEDAWPRRLTLPPREADASPARLMRPFGEADASSKPLMRPPRRGPGPPEKLALAPRQADRPPAEARSCPRLGERPFREAEEAEREAMRPFPTNTYRLFTMFSPT